MINETCKSRRIGLLPCLLLLALPCSTGCAAFEVGDDLLPQRMREDLPVTTATFKAGFALGGAPTFVATLPLTLPLASMTRGYEGLALLMAPAAAVGAVSGGALALPVLPLELFVVRPLVGLTRALRGRRHRLNAPEPRPQARREQARRELARRERRRRRSQGAPEGAAERHPQPGRSQPPLDSSEEGVVRGAAGPPRLELRAGPPARDPGGGLRGAAEQEAGPVEWPALRSPCSCPTCGHPPCPACGHLPQEALPPWELLPQRR